MESIDAFIDRLPKVELHLHLVGSASVPTVLELARRHPDGAVPQSAAELAACYEFRDFPHFAEVYAAVSSLVREPADVAELVLGAARDLAGQNVRYVELTVTPYTFTACGMAAADLTEALDTAARSARRDHGVRVAYIFDIAGELGAQAADATLEHALARPPEALTGFGLAGIEQARSGNAEAFRSVFGAAIAAGLHSVPHAGEMSGPATIWEALTGLRAERIGHGISCLDDPSLVARLRESQIPLEVCPTSNVCTKQVPDLAAHPLPRLLEQGLFVTLNSDDPPMFGTTLTQEYRRAASALGLDRAQLAALAASGVRASFLDPAAKQALLQEIEAVATGSLSGALSAAAARGGRWQLRLRRDDRIGVSGQELLRDLGEGVLGRSARDERERPDDVEAVAWPGLRDDGSQHGGQRRGERRDVVVLPADEHHADVGAHHVRGELGFLAFGVGGADRDPEAVAESLDRLVGPVPGRLALAAVGGRQQGRGGLQARPQRPGGIEKDSERA